MAGDGRWATGDGRWWMGCIASDCATKTTSQAMSLSSIHLLEFPASDKDEDDVVD